MSPIRVFSLRGIPVFISIWFILLVIYWGASSPTALTGLIWISAVTVSILVHEFGHALAARLYGLRPTVLLHGWGGLTHHGSPPSYRSDALIVAAGPGAGLLLGGLTWVVGNALGVWDPGFAANHIYVYVTFQTFLYVNIAWSLINLLPMWPLDGGQLFENYAQQKWSPAKAREITHKLGMGLAIGVTVVAIMYRFWFGAVLAGFIIYENYRQLALPPGTYPLRRVGGAPPTGQHTYTRQGGVLFQSWAPSRVVRWLLITNVGLWLVFELLIVAASQGWAADVYGQLALTPTEATGSFKVWQIGSYMWLHDLDKLQHVVFNMIALWLFGSALERRWGQKDFLKFYLLAGLGAGLFTIVAGLILPGVFGGPVVGASGAILALVAAFSFAMPEEEIHLFFALRLKAKWIIWIVLAFDTLGFITSRDTDIAYHTHLGGILTSWLLVTGNWRPRMALDRLRLWRIRRGKRKKASNRPNLRVIKGGKGSGDDDEDDEKRYLH